MKIYLTSKQLFQDHSDSDSQCRSCCEKRIETKETAEKVRFILIRVDVFFRYRIPYFLDRFLEDSPLSRLDVTNLTSCA